MVVQSRALIQCPQRRVRMTRSGRYGGASRWTWGQGIDLEARTHAIRERREKLKL
jgi:hypothetical protein